MFSGKTTELIRRINRHMISKQSCVVLRYSKDTRYHKSKAMTHDKRGIDAIPCEELTEELHDVLLQYSVVGIDEAQFFRGLVDFANKLADIGKIVIVAGCDATYLRKPFGELCQLVATAESVTKLNSVCKECMEDASFTKRTTNETVEEVIGGAEKYMPICRSCSNKECGTVEEQPNRKRKGIENNEATRIEKAVANKTVAAEAVISAPKHAKRRGVQKRKS